MDLSPFWTNWVNFGRFWIDFSRFPRQFSILSRFQVDFKSNSNQFWWILNRFSLIWWEWNEILHHWRDLLGREAIHRPWYCARRAEEVVEEAQQNPAPAAVAVVAAGVVVVVAAAAAAVVVVVDRPIATLWHRRRAESNSDSTANLSWPRSTTAHLQSKIIDNQLTEFSWVNLQFSFRQVDFSKFWTNFARIK